MKNKFTLILTFLACIASIGQVFAQVNGTPVMPVISTIEKPVYFFVESAANGTVTMGTGTANYLGDLLYVPDTTSGIPVTGINLKHEPKEVITATLSIDNALWQLVLVNNVLKFKNKGTGLYMINCRYAISSSSTAFVAATAFVATPFTDATNQYKIRTTDQASYAVAWFSTANGKYIDRWSSATSNSQIAWYFMVEQSSQVNYEEMYLATIKRELADKIAATKVVITNSSIGEDPGQFTVQAQTDLTEVIDAAQAVHDGETTVVAFQSAISELKNAVSAYLLTANVPILSDNATTRWYFFQGTRPANTYMTSSADGSNIVSKTVIPDDTQLWKFVANTQGTANGFMLVNKVSGLYLNADAIYNTAVTSTSTQPINNLRFIVSDLYTDHRARFWVENTAGSTPVFRLHAGNASVMNWNGNAYDNSSWLIYDYQVALVKFLNETITKAQSILASTVEGDEFGQYSAARRTALSTVLATESAKDVATMTPVELIASNQAIKDAIAAIACNRKVATLSSVDKKKWFRLVNNMSGTGYASGKVMSSNGRIAFQKFTYETKADTSDAQLFCFDLNETASAVISITNKATGLHVGSDGAMLDTIPNTVFAIVALDSSSFKIVPTTKAALHAASANTDILNYDGVAGSASSWKFEFVKTEDVTDFTSAYQSKKAYARTKVNAAAPFIGAQIGQYTNASMQTVETVLAAEEAKNVATLTQDQIKNGILSINAALANGFVVNTDLRLLKSTDPTKYKWFRLINNQTGSGYASGKALSSNGRLIGQRFTYELLNTTSDYQLFRFELSANDSLVAHIMNKATGYYVTATCTLDSISTATNFFAIVQLDGGHSFWIDPTFENLAPLHAQQTNSDIVNWLNGAGSASAWLFEFASETPVAVKRIVSDKYLVRTANNRITVDGDENFEVYSILGQRQNIKTQLKAGVYVVKVNNYTQKVVIR